MRPPDFIKPVIITVTGGRDFDDKKRVFRTLDNRCQYWMERYPEKRIFLINGGAKGLDALAQEWAEERKQAFATIPAEWEREGYGKRAGSLRNTQMLCWFHPEEVIAFPGGPGTADMVATAKKYEFPILLLGEKDGESTYWRPGDPAPVEPEEGDMHELPSYWSHAESDCCVIADTVEEAQRHADAGCDPISKEQYDRWVVESDVGDLI